MKGRDVRFNLSCDTDIAELIIDMFSGNLEEITTVIKNQKYHQYNKAFKVSYEKSLKLLYRSFP